MEGEIRESLILTQEQLDELASVFKSVKHFALSCRRFFRLFVENVAPWIITALDKFVAVQVSSAGMGIMRDAENCRIPLRY